MLEFNEINNDENEFEDFNEDNEELFLENSIPKRIITDRKDYSIREFSTMYEEGNLILRPEYQRKFVMDVKLCSRLIESVLMDVPIPVLYLSEEKDGVFSVIDGQQRLTAFISFLRGKFPPDANNNERDFALKNLNVLKDLNNKKYSDLDKKEQNKIKTSTLNTIVVKNDSPDDIKFVIFERLNTGSIKLNEDEIRNTIYRGNYIKLLAELENNEIFHKIVNKENYKKRMLYRGMILRFFALSEKTYINYKPSMKQFCNKELRDNQNMNETKIKEYKERFKKCIELVFSVFGEKAFRRFSPGYNDTNIFGKWNTTRLNMALFDIQMCGFVNYDKNQIISKADSIREKLIQLMSYNNEFITSIEKATSDKIYMTKRFKIWMDSLEQIIGQPENELRIFPFSLKKLLFDSNSECKICKQQIQNIDDAEVDHIVPYSEGGKTTVENAQLTHRYCNRKKRNRIIISEEHANEFSNFITIFANYRGENITAKLNPIDNSVIYNDNYYNSPSGAGDQAKKDIGAHNGITTNGWRFWKYINENGDENFIDEIR